MPEPGVLPTPINQPSMPSPSTGVKPPIRAERTVCDRRALRRGVLQANRLAAGWAHSKASDQAAIEGCLVDVSHMNIHEPPPRECAVMPRTGWRARFTA